MEKIKKAFNDFLNVMKEKTFMNETMYNVEKKGLKQGFKKLYKGQYIIGVVEEETESEDEIVDLETASFEMTEDESSEFDVNKTEPA